MWFAKRLTIEPKNDGPKRERTLWLCPDCSGELGSTKKCAAFLRDKLTE